MAKIISGESFQGFGRALSQISGIEFIESSSKRFADGEWHVRVHVALQNETAIIVQSTCRPVNDRLMELLLLADAAKMAGARRIIAVAPYFGYSRQNKASYEFGPISVKFIATMLEVSGVDYLITLDLHSRESEKFFNIGISNINPAPLWASLIKSRQKSSDDKFTIVSPDAGSRDRAETLAQLVGANVAIVYKQRMEHSTCQTIKVIGEVANRHCIIVDDIVDTGNTLCNAATALKVAGALSIRAIVTHAVLSRGAKRLLRRSHITQITTTNSIKHESPLPDNFLIYDILPAIGEELKNIRLY